MGWRRPCIDAPLEFEWQNACVFSVRYGDCSSNWKQPIELSLAGDSPSSRFNSFSAAAISAAILPIPSSEIRTESCLNLRGICSRVVARQYNFLCELRHVLGQFGTAISLRWPAQAWGIVCEFVKSDSLRKHMLAVEACVAAYARKRARMKRSGCGGAAPRFRLVGLIERVTYFNEETGFAVLRVNSKFALSTLPSCLPKANRYPEDTRAPCGRTECPACPRVITTSALPSGVAR